VVQARGRDDQVDGFVRQRQVGEIGDRKLDPVGEVLSLGMACRFVHHAGLHVDPVETQIRSPFGDLDREPAAAATCVQHDAAGWCCRRYVLGNAPVHAPEQLAGTPVVGLCVCEMVAVDELAQRLAHGRLLPTF
jgi:hypothetical protein